MNNLASLRADFESALAEFHALLVSRFPGANKYTWYRALSAAKGENTRRNDDTSRDAALASDVALQSAHDEYVRRLHVFYKARDGAGGFLG